MLFDILKAKANIWTDDLLNDLWRKKKETEPKPEPEPEIEIVSWTDGTSAQIKAMLNAEKAGKINTSDYWNVGDKRVINLSAISAYSVGGVEIIAAQSAQTIELALAHKGLYKDANNQSVSWIVTFVDCLSQKGKMNGTNTNNGSWNDSDIRTYLNDYVFSAMSEDDQTLFTQFKTITANPYNGTILETAIDNLALLAEKEIFGVETYSNDTEANALTQLDYYKPANSHVKTVDGNQDYWWQRSPEKNYDSAFCLVNIGGASFNPASDKFGISPFGCI